MVYGAARAIKTGESVSGDNYSFSQIMPGQVIMSLSDGMGSGEIAEEESRQVIELTETSGSRFFCAGCLKTGQYGSSADRQCPASGNP